jgi:hypothetical protein
MDQLICVSCKKPYIRNPRQKKQKYCSDPACQKARKAKWQRDQMKSNPEYKKDQIQAKRDWFDQHPDYWKTYRKHTPQRSLRNSLLQRKRNQQHRLKLQEQGRSEKLIAKMDVLDANNRAALREYWVVPVIAKMDVLRGYLAVAQGERSHFA